MALFCVLQDHLFTESGTTGMFRDVHFGKQTLDVAPEDKIFIYSDGLVESAKNKITWASGAQSLLPVYKTIRDVPYNYAPEQLINELFGKDHLPEDDIVVLCIKV